MKNKDTIYRQEAIDAVYKCTDIFINNLPVMVDKADAYKALAELPSAQPEQRWIPCSERLPEKCGEYLVTREARGVYRYLDIVKKTNISGQIASDIIAWMPLPEPYWE